MLFLVLFVLAFLLAKAEGKPHVETLGVWAIDIRWPDASRDDVDLWVMDPSGGIVYYAAKDIGLMHLEHDDLGESSDVQGSVLVKSNRERVIIRGVIAGEYVANVVMYRKQEQTPTPVVVRLDRLRGDDATVRTVVVTLARTGQEHTAFRFTLDANERLVGANTLQRRLTQ